MSESVTKLLLVDDNHDILYSVKLGLQRRNFEVDAFANPLMALDAFQAEKYDLALLDIQMPEMNGFELYRKLAQIEPELKVCFFTAYENYREQFKKEFTEIRSDCFLRKPMSIERLSYEINKYLQEEGAASIKETIPR